MKHIVRRFTAALVSGALCLSLAGPSLAAEEPVRLAEPSADLMEITTGEYTAQNPAIQAGGLYTLIALPRGAVAGDGLTAADLLKPGLDPLFFGTAKAQTAGAVTFENVRLRSAQAVEYFVTGPGLTTPIREATGRSTSLSGTVKTASVDQSAQVRLVDGETGYVYPDAAQADGGGSYAFSSISPSTYRFYVTKPGYLPYTSPTAQEIPDNQQNFIPPMDISSYVGDVNGDRTRNNLDLAAILPYFGQEAANGDIPQGMTPDLDCNGTVDVGDLALMVGKEGVDVGESDPVTPPILSVADHVVNEQQNLHKLTFTLAGDSTFSAGAFTLRYYTSVIQPCAPGGGTVNPTAGGPAPACLQVGAGVTLSSPAWTVEEPYSTLSFTLAAPAVKVTGNTVLVEFYYKPSSGTTDSMFTGVFQLPLARALVGKQTVVECGAGNFTYPGISNLKLSSISIDQSSQELTIPAPGQNTALFLTVSGVDELTGELHKSNVTNIQWEIKNADNEALAVPGVSVMNGLLTVSSLASQGSFTVTAIREGIRSASITITLVPQPAVVSSLELYKDSTLCSFIPLTSTTAAAESVTENLSQQPYFLMAYDQYGNQMEKLPTNLTWTLSGAPSGVTVENGLLTIPAGLAAGTYTFRLHISCGAAQAMATVELTVEPVLASLSISGPQSANVPISGSAALTYTVTALDNLGNPMPAGSVDPALWVENEPETVSANHDVNGYVVTVAAEAATGVYNLVAEYGEVRSAPFPLSLLNPSDVASHAALYQDGSEITSATLSAPMGAALTQAFSAKLLNYLNQPVDAQPETFAWTLENAPAGVTVSDAGLVTVSQETAVGSYHMTLSAKDETSQLSASIPLSLTISPVLGTLTVAGPENNTLTIPTGDALTFTFALTQALDTQGDPMQTPDDLTWTVVPAAEGGSLTGISIDPQTGALTVQSVAAPGDVVVSAVSGEVSGSVTVTLESTGQTVRILKLYRDGQAVSGHQDSVFIKEGGAGVSLAYTAQVIDPATRQPVEVDVDAIWWLGGAQALTVDGTAAPGVYDAIITAVYQNQSVSVLAQVVVYPNIKTTDGAYQLEVEWEGDMPIPDKGESHTYRGRVIAVTASGQRLPLSDLPDSYTLSVSTPLAGVYPSYDMSTHTLLVTVDSSVSPAYGAEADKTRQVLGLTLSYFPGETGEMTEVSLPLKISDQAPTSIWLYRGQGAGASFSFATAESDAIEAAPGMLTNCYAVQMLDQYGKPMVDQKVTWSLEGSCPEGVALETPSFASQYPNYTDVTRLKLDKTAPLGEYDLTLKAVVAGYTRTLPIHLNIVETVQVGALTVSGRDQMYIQRYFRYKNNFTELCEDTIDGTYTAALVSDQGYEVDPATQKLQWTVTDANDKVLTRSDGVTWEAGETAGTMILHISRHATPTGAATATKDPRLIVTVTDTVGGKSASCRVELIRQESYPLVLTIHDDEDTRITSDSRTLSSTHLTSVYEYKAQLWDQYGKKLDMDKYTITWSSGTLPSGVSFKNGELTINSKVKKSGTFTLSASIVVKDASDQNMTLKTSFKFALTISGSTGGNPGGGPGGGPSNPGGFPSPSPSPSGSPSPSPSPSPSTPPTTPPPAEQMIYPTVTQNGAEASVTLTPEQETALTSSTATGAATIVPTGGTNVSTVNVTVSTPTVSAIAGKDRPLKVQTDIGTVLVPPETLKGLAQQGANGVTVTLTKTGHAFTVNFSSGSQPLASGKVLLNGVDISLTGTGNVVAQVDGDSKTILPKALVDGSRVIAELSGPTQVEVLFRSKDFQDTAGHWARDAITFVTARELFLGTSTNTFSPGGNMTRSMVVTVLHRLESKPASTGISPYPDVQSGTWYTDAVSWADANGIVQGSNGLFSPDVAVTREQLATIFCRYVSTLGKDTSARGELSRFPDGSKTSPWALEGMRWAVATGLITGKGNGTLDPQGTATRAEVATMLERLVRLIAPKV